MNGADTTRVIGRLKAAYDKRLSEDTYAVWCEELATLQFPPAWAATIGLIHDSRFFPSISEFLTTYADHVKLQADPRDQADACDHCDNGFVLVDPIANTVVPCSRCRYDAWKQHQAGWPAPVVRDDTEPELVMPAGEAHDRLAEMRAKLDGTQEART